MNRALILGLAALTATPMLSGCVAAIPAVAAAALGGSQMDRDKEDKPKEQQRETVAAPTQLPVAQVIVEKGEAGPPPAMDELADPIAAVIAMNEPPKPAVEAAAPPPAAPMATVALPPSSASQGDATQESVAMAANDEIAPAEDGFAGEELAEPVFVEDSSFAEAPPAEDAAQDADEAAAMAVAEPMDAPGDMPERPAQAEVRTDTAAMARLDIPLPKMPGAAVPVGPSPYRALVSYVGKRVEQHEAGLPLRSVVVDPLAGLENPVFEPCGDKPLGVSIDLDEQSFGNAEQAGFWNGTVVAAPGVADAVRELRDQGVRVFFLSSRPIEQWPQIQEALQAAGLGSPEPGIDLWLSGERGNDRKDEHRRAIARHYCIIAIAGDRKGDFADLYDYLKDPNTPTVKSLDVMWDSGWFMLPNAVGREENYATGGEGNG
ncbi:MAG: HAD family acid phosphatase [Blastomonas sp.]